MKLAPDSGEAYLALGHYRYNCERKFDLAAQAFATARERLPNNSNVLVAIANLESHQGRFQDALANLAQAFELNPRDAFLVRQKATLQLFQRQFADGRATLDHVREIAPDDTQVFGLKAFSYQAEGDLARAAKELEHLPPSPVIENFLEASAQLRQALYERRYDAIISIRTSAAKAPSLAGLEGERVLCSARPRAKAFRKRGKRTEDVRRRTRFSGGRD